MFSRCARTSAYFIAFFAGFSGACSSPDTSSAFLRPHAPGATGGDDGGGGGPTFGGDGGGASTVCQPNPNNFDIPGNNCDDDGDGQVDNVAAPCDASLAVDGDATAFARALGVCKNGSDKSWGLVSAAYANSHTGTAAPADGQHGILPKFGGGIHPREGASLGALSSGYAREFDDATGSSATFKGLKGNGMSNGPIAAPLPAGFPKNAAGCPNQNGEDIFDLVSVRLKVKVPANASGLKFDFNFWSSEWPEYVCSAFNDGFIAYLTSDGKSDNVSFDAQGNPASVNNGFFDRCTPNTTTGCLGQGTATNQIAACAGGTTELLGTGFDNEGVYCANKTSTGGGATGWLTTQATVKPGETITIEFMIFDVGDPNYDSSVLLDHLEWVAGKVPVGTARPPK